MWFRQTKVKGLNGADVTLWTGSELGDLFKFRKNIVKNWYSNRAARDWNKLSRYECEADAPESLKRTINEFMDGKRTGRMVQLVISSYPRFCFGGGFSIPRSSIFFSLM